MIAKLAVAEIVFCRNDQPGLIERVQPGISMLRGDTKLAICERLLVPIQLLQIGSHCFRGGAKKSAQLGFHIKFPFRTLLGFASVRRWAEKAFLRRRCPLRICAGGNLPKKLRQKWIELRNFELVLSPANFHINGLFRALRAGDTHAAAAHIARLVRASRSTKSSDLSDAPPACAFPLSHVDSRTRVERPSSHRS